MEKLIKMLGAIFAMLAMPVDGRDEKALAKTLADAKAFIDSDEAKTLSGLDEASATLDQLRKDIDAQAEETRKLAKLGLSRGDRGELHVMGYDEIVSLRKVKRVFPRRDTAETFGAIAARAIYGGTAHYKDIVAPRTRDMAESLAKDLDPGVSGSGAELEAAMYMADLIAHVEAVGQVFTECDRVPLATTGATYWPRLIGELTANPTAVAAKIAESSPTFDTVTMTPVKWGTLTPIPNEFFRNPTLLADLGQLLAWLITRAVAYAFDNALVNGDGTADYGTITGILQSSDISAVTAGVHTTLATYDGTDASNVIAGMTKDYVEDPRWWLSLSAERTLRALKSTTGVPLFQRGNNGEPNTIDDYPFTTCQRFPAAASATAAVKWGAFGDLRLAYLFGMLGVIQVALSEHTRFESDVTVVRGLASADAAIKDADAVVTAQCHA